MTTFLFIVGGVIFVIALYRLKIWMMLEALRIQGEVATYRPKNNRTRPLIGMPDQPDDAPKSDTNSP